MGKKEILLIVAIVLTVLAGIAAIIYIGIMGFFTGNLFESGTQSGAGGRGSCSILYPASAGSYDQIGAAINAWIHQNGPGSPLEGKGFLIAKSGAESGVNPALIAGIARKESSFGKHIPDDTYNPFGRTASDSQPGVTVGSHKWYKFNSWDEAIAEEGPYIKRTYIDEGRTTIGAMLAKYCPESECDTDTYITQMTDWMNEITRLAGGALGEECNEAVLAGADGGPTICSVGYTGAPASCGWIEIPDKAEDYQKYGGGSDWGKPSLVNMVMGVAKSWKEAGNTKIQVGDLSNQCSQAPGHASHDRGTDVDIDLPNGMMVDGAKYNPQLAIALAKKFISCGATDIGYEDPQVIQEVNNWATQNNLSGRVRAWTGHKDHFHVRSEKR